jgi:hypothetical protein
MKTLHERRAGLDVHKAEVVAASGASIGEPNRAAQQARTSSPLAKLGLR